MEADQNKIKSYIYRAYLGKYLIRWSISQYVLAYTKQKCLELTLTFKTIKWQIQSSERESESTECLMQLVESGEMWLVCWCSSGSACLSLRTLWRTSTSGCLRSVLSSVAHDTSMSPLSSPRTPPSWDVTSVPATRTSTTTWTRFLVVFTIPGTLSIIRCYRGIPTSHGSSQFSCRLLSLLCHAPVKCSDCRRLTCI